MPGYFMGWTNTRWRFLVVAWGEYRGVGNVGGAGWSCCEGSCLGE